MKLHVVSKFTDCCRQYNASYIIWCQHFSDSNPFKQTLRLSKQRVLYLVLKCLPTKDNAISLHQQYYIFTLSVRKKKKPESWQRIILNGFCLSAVHVRMHALVKLFSNNLPE